MTWTKISLQLMSVDEMKAMLNDSGSVLRKYLSIYLNRQLDGHSDQLIDHCFNLELLHAYNLAKQISHLMADQEVKGQLM